MTKALFKKGLEKLVPADDDALEIVRKLKPDEIVEVDIKRPRNIQHHRKFFSLLKLVYDNQEHYQSLDHVLIAFKFAIGHTEKVLTKRGEVEIPKSISFAKMDQSQFEAFYERALDFCVQDVIPGIGRDELAAEVEGYM